VCVWVHWLLETAWAIAAKIFMTSGTNRPDERHIERYFNICAWVQKPNKMKQIRKTKTKQNNNMDE